MRAAVGRHHPRPAGLQQQPHCRGVDRLRQRLGQGDLAFIPPLEVLRAPMADWIGASSTVESGVSPRCNALNQVNGLNAEPGCRRASTARLNERPIVPPADHGTAPRRSPHRGSPRRPASRRWLPALSSSAASRASPPLAAAYPAWLQRCIGVRRQVLRCLSRCPVGEPAGGDGWRRRKAIEAEAASAAPG